YSPGSQANDAIVKYDIALADEQGEVKVLLEEFTMRTFVERPEEAPAPERGILYSTFRWQAKALAGPDQAPATPQKINNSLITLGLAPDVAQFIAAQFNGMQVIALPPEGNDTAAAVKTYLRQVWEALLPLLEDNTM